MSSNEAIFTTTIGGRELDFFYHSSYAGVAVEILLILGLALMYKFARNSSFSVFFDSIFEKVYSFFESILGEEEKTWVKTYVTTVFFVIFFSNFLGLIVELFAPIFGKDETGEFILEHYISIPTAELNFNIVMAVTSILIVLFMQLTHLKFGKFVYEYFPVWGKGFITMERGNMSAVLYYPVMVLVKIFDIVISIFLGLLEIIGLVAKIISLSFRLFGNMTSGTILLGMLFAGVSALSVSLTGFDFPVLLPLIVYAQETLVALIQAVVFPLLVAIFIKVAKSH